MESATENDPLFGSAEPALVKPLSQPRYGGWTQLRTGNSSRSRQYCLFFLFHSAICEEYYDFPYELGGKSCKIPAIQDELAYLQGVFSALVVLPAIITFTFYGSLADNWGRRPVLALACIGCLFTTAWMLTFAFFELRVSAKWLLLCPAFELIGGGAYFTFQTTLIMIADMASGAERGQLFSAMIAINWGCSLIAPPISSLILKKEVWPAYLLKFLLLALGLFMIYFLQETKDYQEKDECNALLNSLNSSVSSQSDLEALSGKNGSGFRKTFKLLKSFPSRIFEFIKKPTLLFCFLCVFIKRAAFSSENLIYQFSSEILEVEIHETVWLQIVISIAALLVTSILLPLFTKMLIQRDWPSVLVHGTSARLSLLVVVLGFAFLWQARGIFLLGIAAFLCGLGEALEPSLDALGASVLEPSSNATYFTFTGLLDRTAKLIAGPAMAMLYAIRDQESKPLGICFLISSILFAFLLLSSLLLKVHRD